MMKEKAIALMESNAVSRVLGWKRGELPHEAEPALFTTVEALDELLYDETCALNLSKYLIRESKQEGKVLVFLKPCDSFSMNQLLKEHRVKRENVYLVGIPCEGMADTPERCGNCKSKRHPVYDELLGEEGEDLAPQRFAGVEELEAMTSEERYLFWRKELSRCIRCNACRNVCPACSCEKCVFDNPASGVSQKAAVNDFEENLFHIIRAFHVAGRCTDCGECSRVCPEHIPLHLLNRKLIKDMDSLYGVYQAGGDETSLPPMVAFKEGDPEALPGKGGRK